MMTANAIWDIAALGKCDAEQLTDHGIDEVIKELRRDPTLPIRSSLDWSIKLANARQRVIEHIHRRINGHVDRQDVLNVVGDQACDE
jgi:hypothetical protein